MPKERTVDRFFWDDPDVATKLSRDVRLLMVGCWTKLADDEGRFLADAWYVRKEIFGYDEDIKVSDVDLMLEEISAAVRSWHLYVIGAHRYIQIEASVWHKHQQIRWTCKSKLPDPPVYHVDNIDTSVDCGKFPHNTGDFISRDARAVGLCSVVLGSSSENLCASADAPIDFALSPELLTPKDWKRKLFEIDFWPHVWRKVAKSAAWNSFNRKASDLKRGNQIVAAMLSQKPAYELRDTDKRPYMTTWLNQDRFLDEGPEIIQNGHRPVVQRVIKPIVVTPEEISEMEAIERSIRET